MSGEWGVGWRKRARAFDGMRGMERYTQCSFVVSRSPCSAIVEPYFRQMHERVLFLAVSLRWNDGREAKILSFLKRHIPVVSLFSQATTRSTGLCPSVVVCKQSTLLVGVSVVGQNLTPLDYRFVPSTRDTRSKQAARMDISSLITACPAPFLSETDYPSQGGCTSHHNHNPNPQKKERKDHKQGPRLTSSVANNRHPRPLLRQRDHSAVLLPALPDRRLGLQRRLPRQDPHGLLVQCARAAGAGVPAGHVCRAAGREGAWALFERGVGVEYGVA